MLKSLSDQSRFRIVNMLLARNYCVGGLSRVLRISEAAVSQHLRVLKDVGLVTGMRQGYFTHYRVERDVLIHLAGALLRMTEMDRNEVGACLPRQPDVCPLCNPTQNGEQHMQGRYAHEKS